MGGWGQSSVPTLPLSQRSPKPLLMWESSYLYRPMLPGNFNPIRSALALNFLKNSLCFHVGGKFSCRVSCPCPAASLHSPDLLQLPWPVLLPWGAAKMTDTINARRASWGCSSPARQPSSCINHWVTEVAAFINIDPVFGEAHHFRE